MYTVILLITCLVASPLIFKQIWKNSELKKSTAPAKEPTLNVLSQDSAPTTTVIKADTTAAVVTTADGETTAAVSTSEGETTTTTEVTTEPAAETQSVFVQSSASYFDDALFIGDSRTVGIKEYGTLQNADYFCSVGLAAYKIDTEYVDGNTIDTLLSSKKYGKVYIMLGINEVGNDTEYTFSAYKKLVDKVRELQPDALIYLEGNLHVATFAETASISNAGLDALNSRLQTLCDDGRTYYIDINSVFDDENGALTADYSSDGVHVLAKYYTLWCDWLCMNTVPVEEKPAEEGEAAPKEGADAEAPAEEAATEFTSEEAAEAEPAAE